MTANGTYISIHDRRVKLVAEAVKAHSELTEKAAFEVAVHVVYALDHIPENVRYGGK
ncbi:MAG TPA: DUF6307 family protein [Pseudonocardia sp.]